MQAKAAFIRSYAHVHTKGTTIVMKHEQTRGDGKKSRSDISNNKHSAQKAKYKNIEMWNSKSANKRTRPNWMANHLMAIRTQAQVCGKQKDTQIHKHLIGEKNTGAWCLVPGVYCLWCKIELLKNSSSVFRLLYTVCRLTNTLSPSIICIHARRLELLFSSIHF